MPHRRKLAAILSADIVGYSRLMGDDEQATLSTLKAYRDIFARHIRLHEGRMVDSPGDALLGEFPSAIQAVNCAVDVQRELGGRNASLPEHRRMRFRIGLDLGEVTEQNRALYGDAVNIAARLQSLARAGGICVSGSVYDQVEGKLPIAFNFDGERLVKNTEKPVRTYQASLDLAKNRSDARHRRPKRPLALLGLVAGIVGLLAALAWLAGALRFYQAPWNDDVAAAIAKSLRD